MAEIKDISDKALNRLHEELTDILLEVRKYSVGQGVLYRTIISQEDSIKHTYTLSYINCILTSGLAKLYMLMGYTKGEITYKELRTHIMDVIADMPAKSEPCIYYGHAKVNTFVDDSEEIDRRINHIAGGTDAN